MILCSECFDKMEPCATCKHLRGSTLIDIPGVGVVGSSTPKTVLIRNGTPEEHEHSILRALDALCESCKRGEHPARSGYSKSGELCACECRADSKR